MFWKVTEKSLSLTSSNSGNPGDVDGSIIGCDGEVVGVDGSVGGYGCDEGDVGVGDDDNSVAFVDGDGNIFWW